MGDKVRVLVVDDSALMGPKVTIDSATLMPPISFLTSQPPPMPIRSGRPRLPAATAGLDPENPN